MFLIVSSLRCLIPRVQHIHCTSTLSLTVLSFCTPLSVILGPPLACCGKKNPLSLSVDVVLLHPLFVFFHTCLSFISQSNLTMQGEALDLCNPLSLNVHAIYGLLLMVGFHANYKINWTLNDLFLNKILFFYY